MQRSQISTFISIFLQIIFTITLIFLLYYAFITNRQVQYLSRTIDIIAQSSDAQTGSMTKIILDLDKKNAERDQALFRNLQILSFEMQKRNPPSPSILQNPALEEKKPDLKGAYMLPHPPHSQGRFVEYDYFVRSKDEQGREILLFHEFKDGAFQQTSIPAAEVQFANSQ